MERIRFPPAVGAWNRTAEPISLTLSDHMGLDHARIAADMIGNVVVCVAACTVP
jgi:hypothetical protein